MSTSNQPLLNLMQRAEALLARLEAVLPHALEAPDWAAAIAFRYRKRSGSGRIEPVRHIAPIRLDALVEVEPQKQRLLRNTEQFVAGLGANNVLLTGARGTGKSSLIKACLNEFAPRGHGVQRGRRARSSARRRPRHSARVAPPARVGSGHGWPACRWRR